MRPDINQQKDIIVDPYFVIPAKCDNTCQSLRKAAKDALLKSRVYRGSEQVIVGTRHRRFGKCAIHVYVDGPGFIDGRGTIDTILQRAHRSGAVRREWEELFPSR